MVSRRRSPGGRSLANVRFWHVADINAASENVGFRG